jgi:Asp-tRNA(Asn)/Glu-tRNA(Gln) amidotransferase A subunit family amidase
MSSDLAFASLRELSQEIRQRRLSCVEVVRSVLERTQKLDHLLNSFIKVLPEAALEQARQLDAEIAGAQYRGPLHGIPISIKDHIDTAGVHTTAGAKSLMTRVPDKDAAVARRMKQAGTVLIGKANMNKFASGESGDNRTLAKSEIRGTRSFRRVGRAAARARRSQRASFRCRSVQTTQDPFAFRRRCAASLV